MGEAAIQWFALGMPFDGTTRTGLAPYNRFREEHFISINNGRKGDFKSGLVKAIVSQPQINPEFACDDRTEDERRSDSRGIR